MPDVNSSEAIPAQTVSICQPKWNRCRIIKNVLSSSCAILFLFTGYKGIDQLQSTINSREGMGFMSEAVSYASCCLAALFLPTITIRKLGLKLTITLSLLAYCPYIASNFYPEWSTLIPTAVLKGLSASILWTSIYTYLNKLSVIYENEVGGKNKRSVAALFFGISGTFLRLSYVSGSLISFLVLEDQKYILITANGSNCGIQFIENDLSIANNTNLAPQSNAAKNTLTGILLSLSILAVLIAAVGLDPLYYAKDQEFAFTRALMATFKLMQKRNYIQLMPLSLYHGMQDGFYTGDFTKAYIACSWNVYHIGLVTVCFGFSSAICSTLSGRLQKYVGRIPIFGTAAIANIYTFVQFFVWIPDPAKPHLFFVCVSIWGIFNGIYTAGIRALYGEIFQGDEESAFANCYLWIAVGNCLSFACGRYLNIKTKLYLLIFVFGLAQIGYAAVEYKVWKFAKDEKVLSEVEQTNSCKCKETEERPVL